MILSTIEFLDKSQTFLGVLIALVALMLYNHEGNLFHRLLEELRGERVDKLNRLAESGALSEIYKDENFKLINACAKDPSCPNQRICEAQLAKIKMRVNREFFAFQPNDYIDQTKRVIDWREVYLAPMYTFFCCLGLFVIDELLRISYFKITPFYYYFLIYALVISSIFWFLIWGRYVFDGLRIKGLPKLEESHSLVREKMGWYVVVVCILCVLSMVGLSHIWGPYIDYTVLVIVAMLCFTKGLIYIKHLQSHADTASDLQYHFLIRHFFAIVVVSVVVALAVYNINYIHLRFVPDTVMAPKFTLLKYLIFLAVVINGITLPFLIPFALNLWVGRKAKKESEKISDKNKMALDRMKKRMCSFVKNNGIA